MSSTVTYYYNYYRVEEVWESDPSYMTDADEDTTSYTSSDGDMHRCDSNNCPGTDLGTISKVELRGKLQGDGDDKCYLRPLFGILSGDEHTIIPGTSLAWSDWQDVTNDSNAPSPWGWADVKGMDCVVTYDKVAKANTMYCGMAQIQVTYEPSGPPPPSAARFGVVV